jgi:abortive infection bacteriophage resistance protein
MSAIERIEVALRTRWADELALKCGPHGYLDSANFRDVLKHAEDLVKVGQEINRSKEAFVKHYKARYGDPVLPPVRNLCAHHGRLWNCRFTLRLPGLRILADSLLPHREGNPADLLIHNYLVVIAFMLERLGQNVDWLKILVDMLQERDKWELSLMGFFDEWRDREPWKHPHRRFALVPLRV